MNIQIFGTKKCNDTKKAERFFKERGIENMINWEGKDQDTLALIKYIADEGSRGPGDLGFEPTEAERRKLEKILENPSVIKTPVVRNGKQSTLGYQPEVWKGWS